MHRCRECTHQFVWPQFSLKEQEVIYNDSYFSASGDWVEGVWPKGYVEAEHELRKEANEVLSIIPLKQGRLLEIGCAGGFFLDEAKKQFDVVGIELNKSMADHAGRMGLKVICGRIEDIAPEGVFDVVVMMDVLEHLPNPHDIMARISNWLSPNACLVIRGPINNDRLTALKERIRKVLWLDKRLEGYPLDASKFNPRSLYMLTRRMGFHKLAWHGLTNSFGTAIATRRLSP